MLKKFQAWSLLVTLGVGMQGVGCDTAAKQQRAEDARRAAKMAELKRIGAEEREKQVKESSSSSTPSSTPKEDTPLTDDAKSTSEPAADGKTSQRTLDARELQSVAFAGGRVDEDARRKLRSRLEGSTGNGQGTLKPTKDANQPSVTTADGDASILAAIEARQLEIVFESSDAIDVSRTIKVLGKQGAVAIRPGTSIVFELPEPTKEMSWNAGDAPEVIGDPGLSAAFTHVWCRWEKDGAIRWTCYGSKQNKTTDER